ncbi:unnamed protein product [Vitrella brassicaformis CCMP3155]|uniref:VWFA domain-containing protein n=3 Tax=Vitrella brassicaformis TaxID=1169539 RepID=A0A0G4GF16_VITBC|nr:unnamed protein product [Vitrella brassicaformis CCMP3155]|eukprot:CEM28123.1 unnamed protein product [Vitrella brassicaformis CCMP3155]
MGWLSIGDVSTAIYKPERPSLVPRGHHLFGEGSHEVLDHHRWMLQKDLSQQDMCLIGPPGSFRRELVLRFCELTQREVEYLCISRDTSEGDLKLRRELGGNATYYEQQAPVRAAIHGRVLLIEGLEKAERNVLPTLNNLLENREMNLDDGRLLISADRYDALTDDASRNSKSHLVRVDPRFRVIALCIPCPPYAGHPLDPPLRSRFQSRVVTPPSLLTHDAAQDDGSRELLQRLQGSFEALRLIENQSQSLGGMGRLPHVSFDCGRRVLGLVCQLPEGARPSVWGAMMRSWPAKWMDHNTGRGKRETVADGEAQPAVEESTHVATSRRIFNHFQLPSDAAADEMTALPGAVRATPAGDHLCRIDRLASVPCGPSLERERAFGQDDPAYVTTDGVRRLLNGVLQDHASGSDVCLIGPPGCGKSAFVRQLGRFLGYDGSSTEHIFLYEDMSSRDLLLRRITDEEGQTRWQEGPLVKAAKGGKLLVLDGLQRVPPDVLCVVGPLLTSRFLPLRLTEDGETLVRHDRAQQHGDGSMVPIRPSFRVIALATPPTAKTRWLTDEVATYFSFHAFPVADRSDLSLILSSRFPSCPSPAIDTLVSIADRLETSGRAQLNEAHPRLSLRQLIRVTRGLCERRGREDGGGSLPVRAEMDRLIRKQTLYPFMPLSARMQLDEALEVTKSHAGMEEWAAAVASGAREAPSPPSPASAEMVRVGSIEMPVGRPMRPELVPRVTFTSIDRHQRVLEDLARDFTSGEKHVLVIGPQGVGKNRIVDYFCQLLRLEREYLQLHRDTTVQALTVLPALRDGRLVYDDSPLVKAVTHGRVLVVDEADKAPLEVVVVLKSLVEDGTMALSDGRTITAHETDDTNVGKTICVHPGFRMVVLANRPGFPFLGNDFFRECGDVFAAHPLDNPDTESELELVRSYAPRVSEGVLRQLIGLFTELRTQVTEGRLSYPYSMRELINVAKHLDRFNDPLPTVLENVFGFDRFDPVTKELMPIFARHGIPTTDSTRHMTLMERVRHALSTISLSAVMHLNEPQQTGRVALPESVRVQGDMRQWRVVGGDPWLVGQEVIGGVEVREHPLGPPQILPVADFAACRTHGFSEVLYQCRLPVNTAKASSLQPTPGSFVSVAMPPHGHPSPSLFFLSSWPLTVFAMTDPTQQPLIGHPTCQKLVLTRNTYGSGSPMASQLWTDQLATGIRRRLEGDLPSLALHVNGRRVDIGAPQLAWIAGIDRLVVHNPSEPGVPPLLLLNAMENAGGRTTAASEGGPEGALMAESWRVGSLTEGVGASGWLRSKDSSARFFTLVPIQGQAEPSTPTSAYHPADCAMFVSATQRLLIQVDFRSRQARQIALQTDEAQPTVIDISAWSGRVDDAPATLVSVNGKILLLPSGSDRGACVELEVAMRSIGPIGALPGSIATYQDDRAVHLAHSVKGDEAILSYTPPSTAEPSGSVVKQPLRLPMAKLLRSPDGWQYQHSLVATDGSRVVNLFTTNTKTESSTSSPAVMEVVSLADRTVTSVDTSAAAAGAAASPPPHTHPTGAARAKYQQKQADAVVGVWELHGTHFLTITANGEVRWYQVADAALASALMDYLTVRGALPGHIKHHTSRGVESIIRQLHEAIADSERRGGGASGDTGGGEAKQALRMEFTRNKDRPVTAPKHGIDDGKEHVGGGTFAGGTGGSDTAGLGGKGGPYRLDKGFDVHQLADDAKHNISLEAQKAARDAGREALRKRLDEIKMSERDLDLYLRLKEGVSQEIMQLRQILAEAEAKQKERVWQVGESGELDDRRLVDALTGERNVWKRRAERPENPLFTPLPKRISFVFDVSASMYRFNGYDSRLHRLLETAAMLLESLFSQTADQSRHKFDIEISGHNGDNAAIPFVPFGQQPEATETEMGRLRVLESMYACAQYCSAGDSTLEAIRQAMQRVTAQEADDHLVICFSDANIDRYGITPELLNSTLMSDARVHAVCVFIAGLGGQAEKFADAIMAGRAVVCKNTRDLPVLIKDILAASAEAQ